MSLRIENLLTVACVVVYIGLVAADENRCEGGERPHERGLCGLRLRQAHSNLCFLLREVYHRDHYDMVDDRRAKRSSVLDDNTLGLVQRIYSIPLDVLAELDLSKDDWHGLLAKKSVDFDISSAGSKRSRETTPHLSHFHSSNALTRRIIRLLHDARPFSAERALLSSTDVKMAAASRRRSRRSVVSGMVCDCCYNQCSPEELGTYC